jgi:hypothetical protein
LLTTIPHSGNYETLRDYASFAVVDSIKQQRTRKLQGLRMSWKLHKVVEQSVVCAREQELFKKDEKIAQMVVRFVTEQVRLPFPSFLDQESSLITSPCHRALRSATREDASSVSVRTTARKELLRCVSSLFFLTSTFLTLLSSTRSTASSSGICGVRTMTGGV